MINYEIQCSIQIHLFSFISQQDRIHNKLLINRRELYAFQMYKNIHHLVNSILFISVKSFKNLILLEYNIYFLVFFAKFKMLISSLILLIFRIIF